MACTAVRQLRASKHPAGAVSSGSERRVFGSAADFPLNHVPRRAFPKLRVAGSIPVVRFEKSPAQVNFVFADRTARIGRC
jgi:hypothetical protein